MWAVGVGRSRGIGRGLRERPGRRPRPGCDRPGATRSSAPLARNQADSSDESYRLGQSDGPQPVARVRREPGRPGDQRRPAANRGEQCRNEHRLKRDESGETRSVGQARQRGAARGFLHRAMLRCGMRLPDARLTADVLVSTDTFGVHTHGVKQLRPLPDLRPDRMDPRLIRRSWPRGRPGRLWMAITRWPWLFRFGDGNRDQKSQSCGDWICRGAQQQSFWRGRLLCPTAARREMIGLAMTNTNPLVVLPVLGRW